MDDRQPRNQASGDTLGTRLVSRHVTEPCHRLKQIGTGTPRRFQAGGRPLRCACRWTQHTQLIHPAGIPWTFIPLEGCALCDGARPGRPRFDRIHRARRTPCGARHPTLSAAPAEAKPALRAAFASASLSRFAGAAGRRPKGRVSRAASLCSTRTRTRSSWHGRQLLLASAGADAFRCGARRSRWGATLLASFAALDARLRTRPALRRLGPTTRLFAVGREVSPKNPIKTQSHNSAPMRIA